MIESFEPVCGKLPERFGFDFGVSDLGALGFGDSGFVGISGLFGVGVLGLCTFVIVMFPYLLSDTTAV